MDKRKSAVLFAICFCVATLGINPKGVRAQDKNTLDTKVVAEGNTITLSWDKKHPWDGELLARGVSLLAEYKTRSNGVVAERLQAAAPPGRDERFIHFRLPNTLTAAPQSAVCLYFQLPNQKLLPVRKPGPQVLDTVRMRYQSWENVTVANSQARLRETQLAALRHAIAEKDAEIETGEKVIKDRGWESADSCQKIATPQFASGQRPFDVVDPLQQEDVARRICISRIKWAGDRLDRVFRKRLETAAEDRARYDELALTFVMLPPDALDALLQASRQEPNGSDLAQRQGQLRDFRADWARWAASAASYTPQLGGKESIDFLQLQSFLAEQCKTDQQSCDRLAYLIASKSGNPAGLQAQPVPPSSLTLGYVGGALEAYSRCVVDDQKELKTKYEAWHQLQHNAPALAAEAHNELVSSCQRQFTAMNKLRADKTSLEAQLQQASNTQEVSPSTASTGTLNLNASVCQRPE